MHEDGEFDNPYWLNGFSNVLSVDHVEQWGLSAFGAHADVIAAVNTALGTQFPDLESMWMPARGRQPRAAEQGVGYVLWADPRANMVRGW